MRRDRFHEAREVLARLERADGKHVVTALGRAVARELVADGVGHDTDLLVRHSEQLDELTPRELRDRDHTPRSTKHARHDARAVRPRPAVERLRVPEHGKVVHGDDERHARAQGPRYVGQ